MRLAIWVRVLLDGIGTLFWISVERHSYGYEILNYFWLCSWKEYVKAKGLRCYQICVDSGRQ